MATLVVICLACVWALWVMYLAVMNLMRARDLGILPRPAFWLGQTVLWPGYLLDVLVNLAIMTVLLIEVPRELTVSSRVARHYKAGTGWRYQVCRWFRYNLLAPFDPSGKHG